MEKKKIAFFLHTTIGAENGVFFIKDVLNDYFNGISNYYNVTLCCTVEEKKFFHNTQINESIIINNLSLSENKNPLKKVRNSLKTIRDNDMVFLFMPCMSSVLAGILCKLKRKPFIVYFGSNWHDLILKNYPNQKLNAKIRQQISNYLSRKSIFSLHTGKGVMESHAGKNKYLTSPIFTFSKDSLFKKSIKSTLIEQNKIKLLYVGALTKNKSIDTVINAIKEIKNQKIYLDIVGNGDELNSLTDLVQKNDLSKNIEFLGYIQNGVDLFTKYRESDIFILPSFSEGLPRVLYEAAGSSCVIITTPVNSIPYVFSNNYDCLFFQPGNITELINSIKRVIYEKDLAATLSSNSYNTVLPILSEKASEQHHKLIKKYTSV